MENMSTTEDTERVEKKKEWPMWILYLAGIWPILPTMLFSRDLTQERWFNLGNM